MASRNECAPRWQTTRGGERTPATPRASCRGAVASPAGAAALVLVHEAIVLGSALAGQPLFTE